MRIGHFETLKPICPRCKIERQVHSALKIAKVVQQQDDIIIDGDLECSDSRCRMRFPIIDGIPIIFNNRNQYINENFYHITVRSDLPSSAEDLLSDVSGPGAEYNRMRHYMSVYCWDHYGDKAPQGEFAHLALKTVPGSLVKCFNAGVDLLKHKPTAPMIDLGCAVGRCSFEWAEHNPGLVLGIDLNFSLLRIAQRILRENRVAFPLKRSGVVFDRHEYDLAFENRKNVDFWACDALALPFEDESFSFANAMNIFDAVSVPRRLLVSIRDLLVSGGSAVLATPYDWTPPTPMQHWVGGRLHSNPQEATPESLLRKILSPQNNPDAVKNLSLVGEIEEHPWDLRIHNRLVHSYNVHIFACRKT
ncbi:MAG: methyltransferase domain-containing protein [Gammaproteobacteria bacterium]|jgi:SAM-dependent methyltransferase|nr:methyltransferase domain-containing protein [Gammaproteobacteria bacterium]